MRWRSDSIIASRGHIYCNGQRILYMSNFGPRLRPWPSLVLTFIRNNKKAMIFLTFHSFIIYKRRHWKSQVCDMFVFVIAQCSYYRHYLLKTLDKVMGITSALNHQTIYFLSFVDLCLRYASTLWKSMSQNVILLLVQMEHCIEKIVHKSHYTKN